MVEPPVIGFTGVVWPARPTEQLARDLTTGRGAAPMAEAGTAWTQLAGSFGAAVVEYDQIVAELRESWRSDGSDLFLERIGKLRDWLVDAAASAGRNAASAGGQAAAYEVARLAMPHVAEIAALEAAKQSIEHAGAALGAPLVAAAAQVDDQQDLAKADAARVMQSYESATTPLATPWVQEHPPVIATSAALDAEQNAATAASTTAGTPAMPGGGFMPVLPGCPRFRWRRPRIGHRLSHSRCLSRKPLQRNRFRYTRRMPAGRMVPGGGMAPGGAGTGEAERTVRAGAAPTPRPGDAMHMETGIEAAPPVLGGVAEQNAPAPGTAQS